MVHWRLVHRTVHWNVHWTVCWAQTQEPLSVAEHSPFEANSMDQCCHDTRKSQTEQPTVRPVGCPSVEANSSVCLANEDTILNAHRTEDLWAFERLNHACDYVHEARSLTKPGFL